MANPQAVDLTFCQTAELIAELTKRHDAIVVTGIRFETNNGGYTVTRHHSGHRYVCLGLISNMESLINPIENSSLGKPIND